MFYRDIAAECRVLDLLVRSAEHALEGDLEGLEDGLDVILLDEDVVGGDARLAGVYCFAPYYAVRHGLEFGHFLRYDQRALPSELENNGAQSLSSRPGDYLSDPLGSGEEDHVPFELHQLSSLRNRARHDSEDLGLEVLGDAFPEDLVGRGTHFAGLDYTSVTRSESAHRRSESRRKRIIKRSNNKRNPPRLLPHLAERRHESAGGRDVLCGRPGVEAFYRLESFEFRHFNFCYFALEGCFA
mmetsp:Transcript_474/g.874  ORF Transcript_474/g.874 Transcript_474/m.874 type:complete len:242 (+) Transcript_474:907-1632(+)